MPVLLKSEAEARIKEKRSCFESLSLEVRLACLRKVKRLWKESAAWVAMWKDTFSLRV